MATLAINPGSGPVTGTKEQAWENLNRLLEDAGFDSMLVDIIYVGAGIGGRFSYRLRLSSLHPHNGERPAVEVDIPGLPLERVRYTGEPGQNIWHFPRLYVDGSSWVWGFALDSLRRGLRGEGHDR